MEIYVLLLVCLTVFSSMPKSIEAAYRRLNDYLVDNVDNDEVSANMDAAVKFLDEQSGAKCSILTRTPITDLKKFTALQQVISNPKCDDSEYDVLRANEAAVGLHALKDDGKVIRRVDKVMLKIFKDHAEKCLGVYPDRYRSRKEEFDKVALKHVKEITSVIMEKDRFYTSSTQSSYAFYTSENLFHQYIRSYPSIHSYHAREGLLIKALGASGADDPNMKYIDKVADERSGKLILRKDKIKQLVEDYLIKPCQKYVAAFGPDLFIPARFDARVLSKVDNTEQDYYLGWAMFMICQPLLTNEAATCHSVIKSIIDED